MLTDLVAALRGHVPAALASAKVATSQGGVNSCVRLARSWRNNRDSRDSYVDAAEKVEQSIGPLSVVPGPLFFDSEDHESGTTRRG